MTLLLRGMGQRLRGLSRHVSSCTAGSSWSQKENGPLCSVPFLFFQCQRLVLFSGLFLALMSWLRMVRLQIPCTLQIWQLVASHSRGKPCKSKFGT